MPFESFDASRPETYPSPEKKEKYEELKKGERGLEEQFGGDPKTTTGIKLFHKSTREIIENEETFD